MLGFFLNVKPIDQAFMNFLWGNSEGVKIYVWVWVAAKDIFNLAVCLYAAYLFSRLQNLALHSLEIIALLLQNISPFTFAYTTEDIIVPFFFVSTFFKEGRSHSAFQEIQFKRFFCSTCLDLTCVYLYVFSRPLIYIKEMLEN